MESLLHKTFWIDRCPSFKIKKYVEIHCIWDIFLVKQLMDLVTSFLWTYNHFKCAVRLMYNIKIEEILHHRLSSITM